MIFQRFLRTPSVVRSGDGSFTWQGSHPLPNRRSPRFSGNGLSKRLTSSHPRSDPIGRIQYWSERLRPSDPVRSDFTSARPRESVTSLMPSRPLGMVREVYHPFSSDLSLGPGTTVPAGMCSGLPMSETPSMPPSHSSMFREQTRTVRCISSNSISAFDMRYAS